MQKQQNISINLNIFNDIFLKDDKKTKFAVNSETLDSITSEQYIKIYSDIYSSSYPNELEILYNPNCQKGLRTKSDKYYKAGDIVCKFTPVIRVLETYPHEGSEDYRCNCCATCSRKGELERVTYEDVELKTNWKTPISANEKKTKKRKNRYGLLVCEQCNFISYCSEKCINEDWEKFHKYECSFINRCRKTDSLPLPSSKILCIVRLIIWSCESQRNFSMFKNFASHSTKFKQIYEDYIKEKNDEKPLIDQEGSKVNDLDNQNLLNKKIMTEFLPWIDILTRFKEEQVERPEVNKQTRKYLNVINVIAVFLVNSAIMQNCFLESTGFLFDPTIALLNHSCKPNITLLFNESKISMIALDDLKPNQELYISYCYLENPKFLRQFELKQKFYFECKCESCKIENYISIDPKFSEQTSNQYNYLELLFLYWNNDEVKDSKRRIDFFEQLMGNKIENREYESILHNICKTEFGLTVNKTFSNVNTKNVNKFVPLIEEIHLQIIQNTEVNITLDKYPINRIIERIIILYEDQLESNWKLYLKFYILNLLEIKLVKENSKFKATIPFCLRELAFTLVRLVYLDYFEKECSEMEKTNLKKLQKDILCVGIYIGVQSYAHLKRVFNASSNNDIINDTLVFIKDLKNSYPSDWLAIETSNKKIIDSALENILSEIGLDIGSFSKFTVSSKDDSEKTTLFLSFDQLLMSDFYK